jgi:DivIVA domain-containing protein
MALTPEDVVNKRFQSTKFREGYDQDEVDDFLDEIVVELRRLTQENDELRQRLVAADARIAELQRGAGASAGMQAPAAAPMVAPPAPAPAPAFEAPAAPPAAEASADTNNLLQLARRLHEEHVREGLTKKEQLIAEGEAEAARIVAQAASAQQGQLQALEQERAALQRSVDELRTFEREYRQQLRTYIQSQLNELEGTAQPAGVPSAASTPSASGAPQPVAAQSPSYEQSYPGSAPGYSAPGSAPSFPAPQASPPSQYPGYGS